MASRPVSEASLDFVDNDVSPANNPVPRINSGKEVRQRSPAKKSDKEGWL
jgi:hypothetical protein